MLFGQPYPQADFDASWKKVLFNQFHDILPGSGIGINYVDAARKYAEVQRFSQDTMQADLDDLASRVKIGRRRRVWCSIRCRGRALPWWKSRPVSI